MIKNIMAIGLISTLTVAIGAFSVPAAGAASDTVTRTAALEKVIAAAKQEKRLSIVMGGMGPDGFWADLEKLLVKLYGVQVRINYTAGGNFSVGSARMQSEYETGRVPSTDATLMTSRLSYNLTELGALQEISWLELVPDLPPKLINSKNTGLIVAGVTGGIVYNTNLMKHEDVPRTLEQLADPKYKGMMVGSSVATQWPEVAIALGVDKVTKTLEKMVEQGNFVGVLPGCGGHEPIAAGQFPMLVLSCIHFESQNYLERTGAPIGLVFLDEVRWAAPYHWIIPKRSRNTNVAILVGLALATPEGQQMLDKWQGRSSPYVPGTRMNKLVEEANSSGRKFVISDWEIVTDPRYDTLFEGEMRERWRALLGKARKQ